MKLNGSSDGSGDGPAEKTPMELADDAVMAALGSVIERHDPRMVAGALLINAAMICQRVRMDGKANEQEVAGQFFNALHVALEPITRPRLVLTDAQGRVRE